MSKINLSFNTQLVSKGEQEEFFSDYDFRLKRNVLLKHKLKKLKKPAAC